MFINSANCKHRNTERVTREENKIPIEYKFTLADRRLRPEKCKGEKESCLPR